jgi:hypothetical protein
VGFSCEELGKTTLSRMICFVLGGSTLQSTHFIANERIETEEHFIYTLYNLQLCIILGFQLHSVFSLKTATYAVSILLADTSAVCVPFPRYIYYADYFLYRFFFARVRSCFCRETDLV